MKVAVWRAFTATLIFRKVGKIFLRSLFVLELNLNSYNNDFKDIKNWENIFKVAFCLLWFSYDNNLNFFFLTFCLFKVAAIRTFFTCPDCNSSDLKNHKNWESNDPNNYKSWEKEVKVVVMAKQFHKRHKATLKLLFQFFSP